MKNTQITDNQLAYIKAIEKRLDITFEGTTINDASHFITKYEKEYKESFINENYKNDDDEDY